MIFLFCEDSLMSNDLRHSYTEFFKNLKFIFAM